MELRWGTVNTVLDETYPYMVKAGNAGKLFLFGKTLDKPEKFLQRLFVAKTTEW